MQHLDLGHASVLPEHPVVAGSYARIVFTYTAGHPIDDSGCIKIAFRSVSDFGTPQFDDAAVENYVSVSTTGTCQVEPRWDPKGHIRPWSRALFLKVRRGFLDRGETITVVFGDTDGGSPGWQMQTYCEERFEFKTLVDPIATYQFKELPVSPALRIVPGDASRAVCIAPSQAMINSPVLVYLKREDRWGNPTSRPKRIEHPGWQTPGAHTITLTDEQTGLTAQSNPVEVRETDGAFNRYWADFHGQTGETVGSNTIQDYYVFARDQGLLDIVAHQGNDFQVTDGFWDTINRMAAEFNEPGVFVTFPGYEWSGNTPLGGDRNVYFAREGGKITRSCRDLLPQHESMYEDSPTAGELFTNLSDQGGPQPFVFAHVGGRYADISVHDPAVELAVEVHSAWGTFEWLVEDALRRGYRIGICANSDGHKCRPGASYPGARSFGSLGGLTCVLARSLDRGSILEALQARHFYATTGNRCLLAADLTTADGRNAVMGDVIAVGDGTPQLHVRVVGTAPIECVNVYNGVDVIKTLRPYTDEDLGCRVKVAWSGAEVKGRDRLTIWDGGLHVRGNALVDATPVNFWNANHPPKRVGKHQVLWKSVTTGGVAGVILRLADVESGTLDIETAQGRFECEIAALGAEPKVWNCGGLHKEMRAFRLPDQQVSNEFAFSLPLTDLHAGDNPIYVRVAQEDGHLAWTSPIYAA